MNWRGVNVTKLLVRAANNEHKTQLGLVNTLDYMPFVDILGDWLGWSFTIVATDRYTLDVEHEQHMRHIASEFDALFGTLLAGGWYNNNDH